MMTLLIYLQTLVLSPAPLSTYQFNTTLSPVPPPAPAATEVAVPERGKVIKESQIDNSDYRIKTIVIDAGHGGHDPGCLGSNSQEKNLALGIALRLGKAVRERFPEVKVILTRDSDVFVPLYERARIANRNGADLFISIHCNFMPNSEPTSGSETYVMGLHTAEHNLDVAKRENAVILLEDDYEKNYDYDPNSPEGHIMLSMFQNAYLEQSILFAERVEDKIHTHAQRRSRGVKQAGFVVLKETAMPSVLIEAGFLSNRKEEGYLKGEEGQQQMADAILAAFSEYKQLVEGYAQPAPPPVAAPTPPPQRATADPFAPTPQQVALRSPATTPSTASQANPAPSRQALPANPPTSSPGGGSFGTAIPSTPPSPSLSPKGSSQAAGSTVGSVQFCVQLAASPRPADTSDPKWRDIAYPVEVVQEDNLYKYQARNFSTLHEAMDARFQLRSRGFLDAFIVAYKDGRRISLEEARREVGE